MFQRRHVAHSVGVIVPRRLLFLPRIPRCLEPCPPSVVSVSSSRIHPSSAMVFPCRLKPANPFLHFQCWRRFCCGMPLPTTSPRAPIGCLPTDAARHPRSLTVARVRSCDEPARRLADRQRHGAPAPIAHLRT
eukprot:1266996-Rhodomonas_salina.2